jgi:hypothetical protein
MGNGGNDANTKVMMDLMKHGLIISYVSSIVEFYDIVTVTHFFISRA